MSGGDIQEATLPIDSFHLAREGDGEPIFAMKSHILSLP